MASQVAHPNAHPLMQQVNRLRILQGLTERDLAERAGIPHKTLQTWLYGHYRKIPLAGVEACFSALDFRLGPVAVPMPTDEESAEYLRAMGWRVEAPPAAEDARAAGDTGKGPSPAVASSTGQETVCHERGGA